MLAVKVEGLAKTYHIRRPDAPSLRDYVRRPAHAFRAPRTMEVPVLRGIDFEVPEGQVFGVIGRNGAGKSTLLKILSRITTPTRGRATIAGRVASLLEVGTGFHPELTGRENVYMNGMLLGMRQRDVDRVFEEITEFAGIGDYIDTPIKRYSSGMQLRLAFAVAAHLAADTMIIDEVLAVGDAEFQAKCTTAMKDAAGRGRTTLFVSHNMAAIEGLCSRAMLLHQGQVASIGAPAEVVGGYLRVAGAAGRTAAEWVAPPDHAPGAQVRFARVSVTGGDGGGVVMGDDLVIHADFEVAAAVRKLQLMANIATAEGVPVAATCTGDYRADWDVAPGRYRARIVLPNVRLLPRAHTLTLRAFVDWGAEVFDTLNDIVSFTVSGRDVLGTGIMLLADRGVTWTPARYELEAQNRLR